MKLEEGRLEVGIIIILSDLVAIIYLINQSYRGGYADIIGTCMAFKYVGNTTLSSYIG